MNTARLEHLLRRIVREEYPPYAHPPPPHDLDAEQVVLCHVIEHRRPVALEPRHFYGSTHRLIYHLTTTLLELGAELHDERIMAAAERIGFEAPHLAQDLELIREATPSCFRIDPYVERVRSAWRRREALARAEEACALLRLGAGDAADALRAALKILDSAGAGT